VEYSALALLLLRAVTTAAGGLRLPCLAAIIVTVLVAAVFGGLDEWRQSVVPNREPRLLDVALDTASALAACLAVAGWRRLRQPHASSAVPNHPPHAGTPSAALRPHEDGS